MPHSVSQIDADFYRLIHQLVGPQLKDESAERRGARRHPFRATQRIAPRRGPTFPDDGEFVNVCCYDLSRGGFSFLMPSQPDFTSLVAAFGSPSELIYVAAEVVRCESALLYPSGVVEHVGEQPAEADDQALDGNAATPVVLVGCRFTERLERPRERSQ